MILKDLLTAKALGAQVVDVHCVCSIARFHLGIDHVLGARIAIAGATVSVSFDGGVAWHPTHVTPDSPTGFTIGYQDPPAPGTASLRIHVTDTDGGSLDQTIINAYRISG